MNTEIKDAIENLRKTLTEYGDDECVTLNVFFNCTGYEIDFQYRTANDLKSAGISMRNVKGEFIE